MKPKRATWFKLFLSLKPLVDSVPDEVAGKALKACFSYFENGQHEELEPLTFAVFSAIRPYIDESIADYQHSVEKGREGAKARWEKP